MLEFYTNSRIVNSLQPIACKSPELPHQQLPIQNETPPNTPTIVATLSNCIGQTGV